VFPETKNVVTEVASILTPAFLSSYLSFCFVIGPLTTLRSTSKSKWDLPQNPSMSPEPCALPFVGTGVGVLVGVFVGVVVGVLVGVFVGVFVGGTGVFVGVLVGVFVGGTGVFVGVLVGVFVAVGVGVSVGVFVGVFVGGTGVLVGVLVGVFVGGTGVLVGVSVGVFVGGTGVFVGVSVGVGVPVSRTPAAVFADVTQTTLKGCTAVWTVGELLPANAETTVAAATTDARANATITSRRPEFSMP
jgi:hypothetical protein